MGKFSDVLLTVDYDRTLTAPDSSIPERNLEAIRYFMENDGAFTVNTGRSVPMIQAFRDRVPVNAPLCCITARRPMIWRRESCCSAMKSGWTCGRPFGSA